MPQGTNQVVNKIYLSLVTGPGSTPARGNQACHFGFSWDIRKLFHYKNVLC